MSKRQTPLADTIAFGFDRQTDEQSLAIFLQHIADKELLETLLPRMQNEDILATVDFFTGIMRKHLSEEEYHALFLRD